MRFDPANAFLRHLRLGDREVLRGIYAAIRDRHWSTVPTRVSITELRVERATFRVGVAAVASAREILFSWRGLITGAADGTVRFEMDGRAESSFFRNRIGLCVLHPPLECAGTGCVVEHVDGSRTEGTFPREIAPHQPFTQIRAIEHEVVSGLCATVRLEGEVFEMEDQRNWTDASFKIYGTPLDLPVPVRVEAGTRIRQSVTLSLGGSPGVRIPVASPEAEVRLRVGEAPLVRLPRIGLGLALDETPLTDGEVSRLRALRLAHLRVDLHLSRPGAARRLAQARNASRELGAPLEMALFVTDAAPEEFSRLRASLDASKLPVARWLVFGEGERATRPRLVRIAHEILGDYAKEAPVGAGTNLYFAELNRQRPSAGEAELVCYSINPQVHAFDDLSLMESLPMQAETVRNARTFSGAPVSVTPVTLRPRFHPDGAEDAEKAPDGLPFRVDPRQAMSFASAWTLGSVKYLSEGAAESVTYYETTGWQGVMERESGSAHSAFPSTPGGVFPLYHVLADLAEMTEAQVLPCDSSDSLRAVGLALRTGERTRVLLANLSAERQSLRIAGISTARTPRMRVLDDARLERATTDPEWFRAESWEPLAPEGVGIRIELSPYACACLDLSP